MKATVFRQLGYALTFGLIGPALAAPGEFIDEAGDAVVRRTDLNNDGPLHPDLVPPDLVGMSIEGWIPADPAADPYTGVATAGGPADLVRIRIRFDGLVNPPGPIGLAGQPYTPFLFGTNPVLGFFDIDIDHDIMTGGELGSDAVDRYLAQVGRLGMVPAGQAGHNIAMSDADIDFDFASAPSYERTGAEFSIVLCGCFTPTVVSTFGGDADQTFESGESWIMEGRFFERSRVFQEASGSFGGAEFGLYDPVVQVRFEHDPDADETSITLVFPVTMAGAAMLSGTPEEPADFSILNDVSIVEAMQDVIDGIDFVFSPDVEDMIEGWRNADITEFLDPSQWNANALVGTTYTIQQPDATYVWTDSGFDEVFADFNHDGVADSLDLGELNDVITDGSVIINGFASAFSIFDLNADGVIDVEDGALIINPADFSGDGVLDFFDVQVFLALFAAGDPKADLTEDGTLDFFDVQTFLMLFAN